MLVFAKFLFLFLEAFWLSLNSTFLKFRGVRMSTKYHQQSMRKLALGEVGSENARLGKNVLAGGKEGGKGGGKPHSWG